MKHIKCSENKTQAGLGTTRVMGGRGASPEERRKVGQKIKGGGENERLRRQRRKEGRMRRDASKTGKRRGQGPRAA